MLKKERKMKHRRFRTIRATVVLMVIAGVAILIAPAASAAAPTATATLTGSVGAGGTAGSFTFSVTPSSRTLAAYTVTAPAGWQISSVGSPSPSGTASLSGRTISVTGTSVSGSAFGTVTFSATACVAQSYTWSYTATDSQGRAYAHPSTLTASVAGPSCSLALLNQPTDAKQNTQITANPFDAGVQNLQVQLLNGSGAALTTYGVTVTFGLATGFDENGQQLASGTLTVDPETTDVNGVATFVDRLSIAEKNEPQFTSYSLAPSTTASLGEQAAPTITGTQSNGFDIWETQCNTTGGCPVSIRGSNDLYTSPAAGDLSASQLPGGPSGDLPNLTCQGQIPIFANSLFVSQFTGSGAVFLKSHVTRQDMKASANNGQAHVQWCIGLETTAPWVNNGGSFTPEDMNGALDGGVLYVGIAPACPKANPQDFAPCITRQYGDGNGGSYTEGYVPGDPPRRT
jgi:hypothetical protein